LENKKDISLNVLFRTIFRAFKRKEMKASRRLAENDIFTRGITVKIQQVAVHGNYENPTNDAKDLNICLFLTQKLVPKRFSLDRIHFILFSYTKIHLR
jgi:hypothetical protein